ncbi:Anaerobic dimethyl sulfoxide reductase chain B [subsurface metagenome]
MKMTDNKEIEPKTGETGLSQLGFFFDQTRCTGCYACVVACKDWHDVPPGPASWLRVSTIIRGKYPNPFLAFRVNFCYHCVNAPCVAACPAGAISKRGEDGIVVVDRDKCVGQDECGHPCSLECPYNAPQFGAEDNPKMQKCDFCLEEWVQGKQPICVRSCTMRALDAGPIEELRAKYGDVREAEGFPYYEESGPAIIFRPKACGG